MLSFCQMLALGAFAPPAHAAAPADLRAATAGSHPSNPPLSGDVVGAVADSSNDRPLPSVEVTVQRGTNIVANTTTDQFGRFIIHDLSAGDYTIGVHFIGYASNTRPLTITSGTTRIDFRLAPAAAALEAVQVSGQSPVSVNTRTGDQTYNEADSRTAPSTTTSGVIQQAIAGAARAPTGEVHIRGQHAEYTYFIDGVPVPPGISGSLNELFDPQVVQAIDFQTGGWDAEYGGRIAAVINIQTKVPAGPFHMEESTYDGTYNAMGQALTMSANTGKLGMFFSGEAQGTDMRLEPVVGGTNNAPINYHNHGQDLFGFGKLQYAAGPHDLISVDGNYSTTHFDVPYDSTQQALNDHQTDANAFVNLSYRHRFGDSLGTDERSQPPELFIGPYFRQGSLNYRPGAADAPSFVDASDPTATPRDVFENRSFDIVGVKADFSFPIVTGLVDGKVGTTYSHTSGHENFQLTAPAGVQPPIASVSGLNGYDWGTYAETSARPAEWFELRTGLRFDSHVEPFAPNQTQVSPRIRLNFFPTPSNTLYLYFGRLFMPTNIEDLRSITQQADENVATSPTLPERDAFYEVGYIHRFPLGIVTKLSGYHKESTPGIDDNTIPGSAITTDVNINHVWITGLEGVVEFKPVGPVSGYLNLALNHAYGQGPITGGFFPIQTPNEAFDLDHDQRGSADANVMYSSHGFYISATGIFGTGLTNGFTPDANVPNDTGSVATGTLQPGNKSFCTSLLCFNTAFKVPPSYIQNLSLGYTFYGGATYVRPEIFITNLFDHTYLLKGAFFSGESVGRPFMIQFRLSLGV
ncbi:MAG: carboxypeptidase regulatory-like domain-containing protein [Gemmatimonadales bacterium]